MTVVIAFLANYVLNLGYEACLFGVLPQMAQYLGSLLMLAGIFILKDQIADDYDDQMAKHPFENLSRNSLEGNMSKGSSAKKKKQSDDQQKILDDKDDLRMYMEPEGILEASDAEKKTESKKGDESTAFLTETISNNLKLDKDDIVKKDLN